MSNNASNVAIPYAGRFVDYFDAKLFVPKSHFDEQHLLGGGVPEQHVLTTFNRFVKAGDVVIDIGANIGTHTFALASLVKLEGKVYAVEADIDNASYLRLSIVTSGVNNIFLLPIAAADKPGLIRASSTVGTNTQFSRAANSVAVKVAGAVALDTIINEKIALIKLDIEGAELLALRGLSTTIARSRPIILSEFSPAYIESALGSDCSREFFEYFADRNYNCFHIEFTGTIKHIPTYEDLYACQQDAKSRLSWNHIDTLFAPNEADIAEQYVGTRETTKKAYSIPPFLLRRPKQPDVPWLFEEPSLERPTSQLCTAAQMASPAYAQLCNMLGVVPRHHRKVWEYCYILAALRDRGKLGTGQTGLGFGVGREPLPSVFASMGTHVVATDAPRQDTANELWAQSAQWSSRLEDLWLANQLTEEQFVERVRFRSADMNAIPVDLRDFGFCWSSSCLEHLGSIRHGLDFIRNSLAALKPGGVAVHTTELNMGSDHETLEMRDICIFRKSDIESLIYELVCEGHHVAPLNLWPGADPYDQLIDYPPYSDIHIKLEFAGYVTTSLGIIVTKR